MNLQEARSLADIAELVDGGCPVCVEDMVDKLNEAFPEFEWLIREGSVVVFERSESESTK